MTIPNVENAVSKSITVRRSAEAAFRIWTEQITAWWPKGHSISGHLRTEVFMEGKVGGRFYERTPDGAEYVWGEVTVWDPPHYLEYNWYLGSSSEQPTRVEVRFIAQGQGVTRVNVEHYGPNLIGDLWWERKSHYNAAWNDLLPLYIAACQSDQI